MVDLEREAIQVSRENLVKRAMLVQRDQHSLPLHHHLVREVALDLRDHPDHQGASDSRASQVDQGQEENLVFREIAVCQV